MEYNQVIRRKLQETSTGVQESGLRHSRMVQYPVNVSCSMSTVSWWQTSRFHNSFSAVWIQTNILTEHQLCPIGLTASTASHDPCLVMLPLVAAFAGDDSQVATYLCTSTGNLNATLAPQWPWLFITIYDPDPVCSTVSHLCGATP